MSRSGLDLSASRELAYIHGIADIDALVLPNDAAIAGVPLYPLRVRTAIIVGSSLVFWALIIGAVRAIF
ncbi:hypothetical protein [Novosphingobium sp.]|uniref:hypothetical protein n=1 Tax=Novosphingobium sp. TaxID=1874826 RepID=UPI003D0C1147